MYEYEILSKYYNLTRGWGVVGAYLRLFLKLRNIKKTQEMKRQRNFGDTSEILEKF